MIKQDHIVLNGTWGDHPGKHGVVVLAKMSHREGHQY
jgi:hypothetical protein